MEELESIHRWWECKKVQVLWKTNVKHIVTNDPDKFHAYVQRPRETKTHAMYKLVTDIFIAALFIIAKQCNLPSIDE